MPSNQTHINIIYNPFSEEKKTQIIVNGNDLTETKNTKYCDYSNKSLQIWCNTIFQLLANSYGNNYSVEFTGIETDCEDIREAISEAKKQNIHITYTEKLIKRDAKARLSELEDLLDDVQKNPIFASSIEGNYEFSELIDNTFDIFVVATMSSGKSTLINAMLGSDLLPALNEATTATIAEITDNKSLPQGKYNISRTNLQNEIIDDWVELDLTKQENMNSQVISYWNSDIDTQDDEKKKTGKIKIEGNLAGINLTNKKLTLKLSDTPGPNNSQNSNHSVITLEKIKDTKLNPLIIYILNGNNLRVNDDSVLLDQIIELTKEQGKITQDRFIFVLGKMDTYINNDNEVINDTIKRTRDYLIKMGIERPRIFPTIPLLTKLIRIESNTPQLIINSKSYRWLSYLKGEMNIDLNNDLNQYMDLNSRIKRKLEQIDDEALKRSGVPALELYISDYIEKYNEPYRIIRLRKAIKLILENSKAEFENISSLKDKSKKELEELKILLQDARDKMKKSEELDEFIGSLKKEEIGLSDKLADFVTNETKKLDYFMRRKNEEIEEFRGDIKLSLAQYKIKSIANDVENFLNNIDSNVKKINEEEQEQTLKKLNERYKEFISNLFDEKLNKLDINILDNIKKLTYNISQNLNLNSHIKEKNIVVGKRKIERGFWEKLWSLDFRDKYVDITELQKFVDLNALWKSKSTDLSMNINEHIRYIADQIKQNAKDLTEIYCLQLNEKFKEKTKELLVTLERQAEADNLEQTIIDAEEKLAIIQKIDNTLNSISSLEA